MKKSTLDPLAELARQALVLARGTARIEDLHSRRIDFTPERFQINLEAIIADTAKEYGPEFEDNFGREQMFDNAELPN